MRDWLDLVRDGTPMPDFRGKADDEKRADQIAAASLWSQAVINANNTPFEVFAKSAAENSHVTFAHLWNSPDLYRGKVITVKGRLVRVRKLEATLAAQAADIPFVYEGWIFGATKRSHPFCVLFPVLPDGLEVAESMDREVVFHGYFIKKMKYRAGDNAKFLETPVLIGPSVLPATEAAPTTLTSTVSMIAITWVFVLIAGAALCLVLVGWYLRRGDQAWKTRLDRLRAQRSVGLEESGEATASEDNVLKF